MTFQSTNNLYGFPQSLSRVFPPPVISQRNPTTSDFKYPIGQTWVNETGENAYILVEVSGNSATWSLMASESGTIERITTGSGVVTPVADNVNLFGTANQLATSGSGPTVTFSIPSTFITPGTAEISSTLTVDGNTSLQALTQVGTLSLNATGGASSFIGSAAAGPIVITSSGTIGIGSSGENIILDTTTDGSSILMGTTNVIQTISLGTGAASKTINIGSVSDASSVNILSGSGNVNINTTGSGETILGSTSSGITSVLSGDNILISTPVTISIEASTVAISDDGTSATINVGTGAAFKVVSIGSTVGASSTAIQSGSGDVSIVGGNLALISAGKQLQVTGGASTDFIGTVTLTSGGASILNASITANDRVFLSRINPNTSTAIGSLIYTLIPGTGFDIFSVNPSSPGTDITADVSTVAYFIVRQI